MRPTREEVERELDVMQTVVTVLQPLTPAARQRVLTGVANGLGLWPEQPPAPGDEGGEQQAGDSGAQHETDPSSSE